MNGHKLSGTRQFNRHWQSGEEGGYTPLIPMHDFTNIRISAMRLIEMSNDATNKYYKLDVYPYMLFLPNYNKIYFYMLDYQYSYGHCFEPLIISCNFVFQINKRKYSSNDLYNLFQNHPEKFHNVSMSKVQLNICGEIKYYYMITFNDSTHNPEDYFIDYVWGSSNVDKIDLQANMVCYNENFDARVKTFYNISAYPFHKFESSINYNMYEHCGIDHLFSSNQKIQLGTYANYIIVPEVTITGSVTTGMDINDLFNTNGSWKLGSVVVQQDVFTLFEGYHTINYPYQVYNGAYNVYANLICDENPERPPIEMSYNSELQLCKELELGANFHYEGATLFYNNLPILIGDFNYFLNFTGENYINSFRLIKTSNL